MLFFVIGALRAIVEMLGLCLIAQGTLYLLAGQGRAANPIYQFFSIITAPPRRLVAWLLPQRAGAMTIGIVCFTLLLLFWLGLAVMRKFI
ncbi:hypothetical protein [Dechloromonas denitrificans]|uniref:hypothetical protein n=1 Tax=Dechloromonas denitrificans TaxID=281362 RepID=UPI001CFB09DF|nr:hypothetical protein [Dechloromonas denitrificans]UCV09764.1 hypothetical protein KI615_09735 [Dechloromonas denitrificans]